MKLLIENTFDQGEFKSQMVQKNGKIQKCTVTGPMIVTETKNRNGRWYDDSIIAPQVKRFNTLCEQNNLSTLIGIDHPVEHVLPLKEAAGRIMKIWKEDKNTYWGSVDIFPDSPGGSTIINMLERKMYPGFSTRALGSLVEDYTLGVKKVTEDFNFISVDFVSDPSAGVYASNYVTESMDYRLDNGRLVKDMTKYQKEIKEHLLGEFKKIFVMG